MVPAGKLRFAMTCRYIIPSTLNAQDLAEAKRLGQFPDDWNETRYDGDINAKPVAVSRDSHRVTDLIAPTIREFKDGNLSNFQMEAMIKLLQEQLKGSPTRNETDTEASVSASQSPSESDDQAAQDIPGTTVFNSEIEVLEPTIPELNMQVSGTNVFAAQEKLSEPQVEVSDIEMMTCALDSFETITQASAITEVSSSTSDTIMDGCSTETV